MNPPKIMVKRALDIDIEGLDIQHVYEKLVKECESAGINPEKAYLYFDAGYNNVSQTLQFESEETDNEYKQRLKALEKEKQRKLKEKEDRRKTYEKLRKEFEGK